MPSVSFLPGVFVRKLDSSLSDHLAEIQGLLCPEGLGGVGGWGAGEGLGGHFHSGEDFQPRQLSGQGGALY